VHALRKLVPINTSTKRVFVALALRAKAVTEEAVKVVTEAVRVTTEAVIMKFGIKAEDLVAASL
jgi:hypothetical protein